MIGTPRLHERQLDSTNERARTLAGAGAPHGTLVTAEEQRAGRGRQGRAWIARRGDALLMSLVVRPPSPLLPLAAALAVCDACERLAPVACLIKWPNDVWIERRKVAGILVEGRPQEGWAVAGIGLNVRSRRLPTEIAAIATSLALHGGDASVEDALAALLAALERHLAASAAEVVEAWRARDALLGEPVRWNGGSGTAAGIDDGGSLLVERPDGAHVTLDAGEVHLLR